MATKDFIRCMPLAYSWHDGAFWIFTESGLKFKALKANKRIAAAVFERNTSFGGLKMLRSTGSAIDYHVS
jgi:nitroimidazol reductase NimA-like FMN-containing flavoprotein (pyridoxamine 5'-phosphate oxidase superfamily)